MAAAAAAAADSDQTGDGAIVAINTVYLYTFWRLCAANPPRSFRLLLLLLSAHTYIIIIIWNVYRYFIIAVLVGVYGTREDTGYGGVRNPLLLNSVRSYIIIMKNNKKKTPAAAAAAYRSNNNGRNLYTSAAAVFG